MGTGIRALLSVTVMLAAPAVFAADAGLAIPAIPDVPSGGSLPAIPAAPGVQVTQETAKKEEPKKEAVTAPAIPVPGGADKIGGTPVAAAPASTTEAATNTPPGSTAAAPVLPPPNGLIIPTLAPPPATDQASTTTPNALPPLPTILGDKDKKSDEAKDDDGEKPLPDSSLASKLNASPMGIVLPPAPKLPKVHVATGNRGHSWDTELKPVMTPQNIKFNYRRQLMPGTIYRPQYDADNHHLPTSVTREDYDRWLLESVAANDIDATRALLDAGANPNVINAQGDPALVVALNHSATDTARLLIARGAASSMVGPSGRSPNDVAAQTGQLWLMAPPSAPR